MPLSLTISLDEIPEPGLPIAGELPPEWLAESLLDAYTATGPVTVALEAKKYNANVYVEGKVSTTLAFQCSRTLEPGTLAIDLNVSELYQPSTSNQVNLGDGVDAEDIDDELRTYEGKSIDLEPTVRELIVLAQDPYPTVGDDDGDDTSDGSDGAKPVWASGADEVDPRWAALQKLKIN